MLLAIALLAAAGALQEDGESPEGPPERQITLVIYGEDRCPESTENEVVVCARRPEEERYRVPPRLRREGQRTEQAWTSRVETLDEASRPSRPNSCSTVGTYGFTGCTQQMIQQWLAERRAGRR
jgi:hypothetical protein